MTTSQYLGDQGFRLIDAKLRNENNLNGFDVTKVTKQVVNGFIYTISYKNSVGTTITYTVILGTNGKITVDNVTN